MRLSNTLIRHTLEQLRQQPSFEDTVAIPDDNPVVPKLANLFGDHTFFLDGDGLHVVEPVKGSANAAAPAANIVKVASWTDAQHTALSPQQPEPTDVTVDLGAEE